MPRYKATRVRPSPQIWAISFAKAQSIPPTAILGLISLGAFWGLEAKGVAKTQVAGLLITTIVLSILKLANITTIRHTARYSKVDLAGWLITLGVTFAIGV